MKQTRTIWERYPAAYRSSEISKSLTALRALRESDKYWLTLASATHRPLDVSTELAELIRRLRVKLEPNPAESTYIHTVPGRGNRYTPG